MINHEFDIIRVLIASQDDEMIIKLILCLTDNAYETVTVNNTTDARKNLLSFQPHILLVDRQIPTMNSLALCREIHNACNIPIFMKSNDDNIVDCGQRDLRNFALGGKGFAGAGDTEDKAVTIQKLLAVGKDEILGNRILS